MTFLFLEKGMGDCISCICRRYNKRNNKYLTSYYPKKEQNITIDWEKINLHDYAIKSLPTSRLKWSDPTKFKIDVMKTVREFAF